MGYTILSEITPYNHSFLFHIFENDDKIYLNMPKSVLVVWVQEVHPDYASLDIRPVLKVELEQDELNLADKGYTLIREILRREIIDFEAYEFQEKDILRHL